MLDEFLDVLLPIFVPTNVSLRHTLPDVSPQLTKALVLQYKSSSGSVFEFHVKRCTFFFSSLLPWIIRVLSGDWAKTVGLTGNAGPGSTAPTAASSSSLCCL